MWPSLDFKKLRGFKIGLISVLVVALGFALAALDLVGAGRIFVIVGIIGGFIGFAVHIGEMLEEYRRARR